MKVRCWTSTMKVCRLCCQHQRFVSWMFTCQNLMCFFPGCIQMRDSCKWSLHNSCRFSAGTVMLLLLTLFLIMWEGKSRFLLVLDRFDSCSLFSATPIIWQSTCDVWNVLWPLFADVVFVLCFQLRLTVTYFWSFFVTHFDTIFPLSNIYISLKLQRPDLMPVTLWSIRHFSVIFYPEGLWGYIH